MRKALALTVSALALTLVFTLSSAFSTWFAGHIALPAAHLISGALSFTNWPVAELIFVAGAPAALFFLLRALIRRRAPRGTALALSAVLLLYAILWVPMTRVPARESKPYETWRLMKLCQVLGDQAAELRGETVSPGAVPEGAREAVSSLGLTGRALRAPKFSRFPQLLKALKIAGLYSPWTGEAILSPLEPSFALPFLASHELAHAAGVAREDEANFVAYQACMAGDRSFQYSGTIYALRYAMDALRAIDLDKWFEIRRGFSDGVREDFTRIDDLGGAAGGLAALSDRAAEAFLHLSGQPAGLLSYTGVVNFLLDGVALVEEAQTLQRQEAVQYID